MTTKTSKQSPPWFDGNMLGWMLGNAPIMGIDPSLTSTGWCVIGTTTGTFPSKDFHGTLTSGYRGPERLGHLRRQLRRLLEEMKPRAVAIEGYSFGSRNAREALGEWGGILRLELYDKMIPTIVVAPQTLKKFVLPAGSANAKNMMALATYKRWGVEFATDDECDAHALAQLALIRMLMEMAAARGRALVGPVHGRSLSQRMTEAAAAAEPLIRAIAPAPVSESTRFAAGMSGND